VNKDVPKPVAWNAESAPLTGIGKMKKEMVYIFWFEFIGTFLLTFSIYASKYILTIIIVIMHLSWQASMDC
jgi:hypothetical protein